MKLTSREHRQVAKLREHGEKDFEREKGRPATARELREIQERATKAIEGLAQANPDNR